MAWKTCLGRHLKGKRRFGAPDGLRCPDIPSLRTAEKDGILQVHRPAGFFLCPKTQSSPFFESVQKKSAVFLV